MTFGCENDETDRLLAAADDIEIIVQIQPRPSLEALGADDRADESPKNEAARDTERMTPRGERRGWGLCQRPLPDISEVDSRHIEEKSLFLENDTDDSPDSKFHVVAKLSSFTLDLLK